MQTTTHDDRPPLAARGMLLAVIAVGSIAGLLSLVVAAMALSGGTGMFQVSVPVATPLETSPTVAGSSSESEVAYDSVAISSWDELRGPRTLAALSTGSYFALFFAACVAVVLLGIRLWRLRPFTTLATASALALGTLAVVVSVAGPWLRMSAVEATVAELGYPIAAAGPGAEWVAPPAFDYQDIDWLLLAFGVLFAVVGVMFAAGRRTQRDTEGLV